MPDRVFDSAKSRANANMFNKSSRKSSMKTSTTPGPGFYSGLYQFGKDSKKVSILSKQSSKASNANPGPGAYEASNLNTIKEAPRKLAISHSTRGDLVLKDHITNPGPGSYASPIKFG